MSLLTEHVSTVNDKLNKDMILYMMADTDQSKKAKEQKDWLWLIMQSYTNPKEKLEYKTPYKNDEDNSLVLNIEAMAFTLLNSSLDAVSTYKSMINNAN